MPELPDVDVYVEHLAARTVGHALERVRLASPFVLRTADPPLAAVVSGRKVARVSRLGKRIVLMFAAETKEAAKSFTSSSTSWSRAASGGSPRGAADSRQDRPRRLRLRATERHAHPHRGEHQEAREHPSRTRRRARGARPRRIEVLGLERGGLRGAPPQREPHVEARAHRSASLQRHRQCVLRRDLASCTACRP